MDRGAGREPDQQALAAGAQLRHVEGVVVGHRDHLVDHRAVEHLGDEPGTDPLDLVGPGLAARQHRGGGGLDRDHQRLGPPLLQHLADTGDRASGADSGDEGVHLAAGGRPDLLGGRAAVDLGVGGVVELLRHEGAPLIGDLAGQVDGLVHAAQRRRLVHLGAIGAQQVGALAGHPLGERQDALVAARRADHRQRDAGVAAGRLDDQRATALDLARLLGSVDHRHPDPVLDRARRVEVLQFRADLGVDALAEALQGDHRRVADRVG